MKVSLPVKREIYHYGFLLIRLLGRFHVIAILNAHLSVSHIHECSINISCHLNYGTLF